MNRFFKYLDDNFNKKEVNNRIEYSYKEIPSSLVEYYNDFTKNKKVFWTVETMYIIYMGKGASIKEIFKQKKVYAYFKKRHKKSPYTVEKIPKWCYRFFKLYKYLSLYRDSIQLFCDSLGSCAVEMKPNCLRGKFYIGRYAGITPESCPIFTNKEGNIFVYDAETFRNYPDNEEEIEKYLKQDVRLIARWDNIEDFLIDECKRLNKLFIENPSIHGIKNCAPQSKDYKKNS